MTPCITLVGRAEIQGQSSSLTTAGSVDVLQRFNRRNIAIILPVEREDLVRVSLDESEPISLLEQWRPALYLVL